MCMYADEWDYLRKCGGGGVQNGYTATKGDAQAESLEVDRDERFTETGPTAEERCA